MNKEPTTNPFDFIRQLVQIKLTKETRMRMRVALSAYADMHVLPAHMPAHSFSPSFLWIFRKRATYAALMAFVLVVATGTQATLASEKAVPGDILYSVKVSVTEPVALAFTASGEEKAGLATKFASRRVKEASTLSAQGKLDEKTAIELAARFDTHIDVISKEAATIEAKGDVSEALAVRTDLENNLSESTQAFTLAASEEPEGPSESSDIFTAHISAKTRVLALEREELASALAVQVASTTAIVALDKNDIDPAGVTLPDTAIMVAASSTATSTIENAPLETDAPGERIFKAFFFKNQNSDLRYSQ